MRKTIAGCTHHASRRVVAPKRAWGSGWGTSAMEERLGLGHPCNACGRGDWKGNSSSAGVVVNGRLSGWNAGSTTVRRFVMVHPQRHRKRHLCALCASVVNRMPDIRDDGNYRGESGSAAGLPAGERHGQVPHWLPLPPGMGAPPLVRRGEPVFVDHQMDHARWCARKRIPAQQRYHFRRAPKQMARERPEPSGVPDAGSRAANHICQSSRG